MALWSLVMDKYFHPTRYNCCNYLSVLELKLNHVTKRSSVSTRVSADRKISKEFDKCTSKIICTGFTFSVCSSVRPSVDFKMAARQPYWILRLPNSSFSFALNIKSQLYRHITCVYWKKPIDFKQCHFQNGRLAAMVHFSVSGLCRWHGFWSVTRVCFGISISIFSST